MEEEKKEILVIKSDKEWIQYFKARVSGIIPFMLMEIVVVIAFNYDLRKRKAVVPEIANVLEKCIIVGFIIVNIFLILNIYRMWRDIGRELILDKMGVLAKMCFYEKRYEWKEFKIRQLRKNLGEYCYDEGLFLTKHKHQPRQNNTLLYFFVLV